MVKTGIKGLDNLLKGGVNKNSCTIIQGSPGTGKTILALQYIYEGALMGEPGLFITSELRAEDLREYASSLGMSITKLEKKGMFNIVEQPILKDNIVSLSSSLKIIKEKKVKRVALDSLTLFRYEYPKDQISLRKALFRFISSMKESNVTLFATAERHNEGLLNFQFESEDFLFDGLIFMFRVRKGPNYERCLTVMKMRGQELLTDICPISIGKGGIKVYDKEIPFGLIEEDIKKF